MHKQSTTGLRILITNNALAARAGSELYVRDLAIALMKRGHNPVVYSMNLGEVSDEIRRASIPVIDDLKSLNSPPDLIHGQHHLDALTAMLQFPDVPAIFACHGWSPWEELPPIFPSIRRYVAVDDLCRERLLSTYGISEDKIETLYNFVDIERFTPRIPLPSRPKSALIFSNYATDSSMVDAIRAACLRFGITQVDVIGSGYGKPIANPEKMIGNYDVVFAKARCALEALSSGCAVVVADFTGLGGLVTSKNVESLRRFNFGMRTMQNNVVTEENVLHELQGYDSGDALQVSEWIRNEVGMSSAITRWLGIYDKVLVEWSGSNQIDDSVLLKEELSAASTYLRSLAPVLKGRYQSDTDAKNAKTALAHKTRMQAALEVQLAAQESELTRQKEWISSRDSELASLAERLSMRESELTSIYDSRAWRTVTLYRKLKECLRKN